MDVLRKKIGLLTFSVGLCVLAGAQDKKFENLSIDRPDVSNLPTTVLPNHYQFELGAEWGRSDFIHEFSAPNLLFRTGLNRKSELRVGFTSTSIDSVEKKWNDKTLITTLSVKYRILEEKNGRPSVAIQPEFSLPFGDGKNVSQTEANFTLMNYSLIFLFNNTLHKKVFFNYNTGILWNKSGEVDYLLSTSTSFAHTHRLGYFLEVYSIFNSHEYPLSIDGGVTYLLRPRFQFDLYAGNRHAEGYRFWFYGAGVGFRLDPESFNKTAVNR